MLNLNLQFFGGRGGSSGVSVKGERYGTEYSSLLKVGNVRFVRYNGSVSAKPPQETMTRGRVYATVNAQNEVAAITYYDANGKRTKTIDLNHEHEKKRPHTHHGYNHAENGTSRPSKKERDLIDFVLNAWYTNTRKQ